jgi:hypothetical protein
MVRLLQVPRPVNTDRNTTPTPLPGAACYSYESRRSGVALLPEFARKDKSSEPLHARTRAITCKDKPSGPHGALAITGPRRATDTAPSHAPMRCAYAPGGRGPLVAPGARRSAALVGVSAAPWGPWTAPRWAATKLHRTSKRRA